MSIDKVTYIYDPIKKDMHQSGKKKLMNQLNNPSINPNEPEQPIDI